MTEEAMPDAIPAATLVIFRDRAHRAAELLMVERAQAMVFAAGALVFPGGRIDPGDHALALLHEGDNEDNVARIAAIRETIEEVGLPVGLSALPCKETLAGLRAALHAGTPFGDALHDAGLTLDLSQLVSFARWLPRHRHMRIFDTRFYLTRLPEGAPEPRVDDTENVRVLWTSAQAVLDAADAGTARIIFPTRRNLERLAPLRSFADAVRHAHAYPQRIVTPWQEERDGVVHLCIPDDLGYPITAEPLDRMIRG